MKKNAGVTLIELMIVIALFSIVGMMGLTFFRQTFQSWNLSRDAADVQSDSRLALDEMSMYIRQASTVTIPSPGAVADEIVFKISKSTIDWSHSDLEISYFKTSDSIHRRMKGAVSTLVSEGVEDFEVIYSTIDARYESVHIRLLIRKGDMWNRLTRDVVLRTRRVD